MSKEEVRKLVGTGKMVIGSGKVTQMMKAGELEKVFLASNASRDLKEDIARYSEMSGTGVEELDVPNEELGVLCRKPFSISVLGKKK